MRLRILIATGLSALLSAPAPALDDGSILWVSWIQPKPGMERQLEEGIRAHHEWRRTQHDRWVWIAWQIGSGPRAGTIALGTFNHPWSDFDAPPVDPKSAEENFRQTVRPHAASVLVEHYAYLGPVSNSPADLPPRKASVTEEIQVKGGREREFLDAIGKISSAIKKAGWPNYYEWFRLDTGGDQPTYARVRLLWS